jgi:hypothetical protein
MRVGDLALWKATGKGYDVLVVVVKSVSSLGSHYYCRTIDDGVTFLVSRRNLRAVSCE